MNDTKVMPAADDITAEITSAKIEIEEEINTANQKLADAIKEQEDILDKRCASIDEKIKQNADELKEIRQILDENWKMLRQKASFH